MKMSRRKKIYSFSSWDASLTWNESFKISCAFLNDDDGCYSDPFLKKSKVLTIENHFNASQLSLRVYHHRVEEWGSSQQMNLEKVEGIQLPYPYLVSAVVINLPLRIQSMPLIRASTIKFQFALVKFLLLKNEQWMLQFIDHHLHSPHLQNYFHHSNLTQFHPL